MNTFRIVSRVLAVSAVVFVGNAVAVKCPIFRSDFAQSVENNKGNIAASFLADKMFDKNEHFKKSFITTAGFCGDKAETCASNKEKKNISSGEFAERLAINYVIRKGSDALNIDGLRNSALKQIDVLPAGMVRDCVNPVVQQVAETVTHPEFLTYLVMHYGVPAVIGMLGGNSGSRQQP